jgi:Kef-type K+ transport system membrane component KefB
VALRIAAFFVVGIAAGRWLGGVLRRAEALGVSQGVLGATLVIVFVYAWAAEYLGAVAAITGAYLAGVLIAETPFKEKVDQGIHPLTYSMFVASFSSTSACRQTAENSAIAVGSALR